MIITKNGKIPKEVIVPILNSMHKELGKCCDSFITYEFETLRNRCGPAYAGVPLDDVRTQSINLRKKGVLQRVKGHGPETVKPNDELLAYYETSHWKSFRIKVMEFWEYRCAVCDGPAKDVHHRTYKRLNCENMNDCIAVCRHCHKFADKQRQRRKQERVLF